MKKFLSYLIILTVVIVSLLSLQSEDSNFSLESLFGSDDFEVHLNGLQDLDNDNAADDLAAGVTVFGEAQVKIQGTDSVVNIAKATGTDAGNNLLSANDTATVITEQAG